MAEVGRYGHETAPSQASVAPDEMRSRVRAYLSLHLDSDITDPFSRAPDRVPLIRAKVVEAVRASGWSDDDQTVNWLMDDLVGLGPLQKYMDDPSVSDVLVNRWDEVYVERGGRLVPTPTRFRDQAHLEQVIQKIVALVGREISVEKPLVDARMSDGSRANAVYAPVGGPTLCIRKFNHLKLNLVPSGDGKADWVGVGGMSLEMAEFLLAMARCRANVLISGATGAGKSTLLRSLVSAFPEEERVVTIEDTAELELDSAHWVKLECVHSKSLGDPCGWHGPPRLEMLAGIAPAWGQSRALSATPTCHLEVLGTGRVQAVVDRRSFVLEDGREIRLPGIEVPLPPLPGETGARAEAGAAARAALEVMVAGQTVELRHELAAADRYGRIAAHVFVSEDGAERCRHTLS